MPSWVIDAANHRATLRCFGGKLIVSRTADGRLASQWTSPGLPAEVNSGIGHIGRFGIDPVVVGALTPEQGREMLGAKWVGVQTPWRETDETKEFDKHLHGWVEADEEGKPTGATAPGAACWIAPHAVRHHLAQAYPAYFRPFADEAPPDLFVSEKDPF